MKPFVIACGDEGVQLNQGIRLGLLGAGIKLPHADVVLSTLKKILAMDLRVVASAENNWIKEQFDLGTFEQADATMQQQAAVLADQNGLMYSGFLPFSDPQDLDHEVRGHMVRPKGVHIANKLCFTLAGGEQTYNLGNYVISAEWAHAVKPEILKAVINTQVEYYTKLAGQPLKIVMEAEGTLGKEVADQNREALSQIGITAAI